MGTLIRLMALDPIQQVIAVERMRNAVFNFLDLIFLVVNYLILGE